MKKARSKKAKVAGTHATRRARRYVPSLSLLASLEGFKRYMKSGDRTSYKTADDVMRALLD